jgi:protein-S-isoprenylcysteine O-methyltransferase Ste14
MAGTMTRWGIGPRFAILSLIVAVVIGAVNYLYFPRLLLGHTLPALLLGTLLILLGVAIFFVSTYQVHTAFSGGRLVTGGVYGYIRHPVYAVWILLIAPGLLLITGMVFLIIMPFFMEYRKRVKALIPKLI